MALTRSTDPLVWIDCEMTGLDSQHDTILSISILLTTSTLTPLEPNGLTLNITHSPAQLASMSEWCVKTHGASGLTALCLDSSTSTTAALAAAQVLAYIKHHIPTPGTALLAGNSIHADKAFLMVPPWNVILAHLPYRLFDVSAMKEMVRRWAPEAVLQGAPVKQLRHTAREDVLESIEEARYFMGLLTSLSNINPTIGTPSISPPNRSDQHAQIQAHPHPNIHLENGAGSNTLNTTIPMPLTPVLNVQSRQGQEILGRAWKNGNVDGDVGTQRRDGEGERFRTDVP